MINTENRIHKLEKELSDLQADREKAGQRAGELRGEIESVLEAQGVASFDSFRNVAGAEKRLEGLQERKAQLEAELGKMAVVEGEAETRLSGVEDALAEAHREENRERVQELQGKLSLLEEQTTALLRRAGEGLDEVASVQHELASLAAEESSGGMPGPQMYMMQRQNYEQGRDSLVRSHLGSHVLDTVSW